MEKTRPRRPVGRPRQTERRRREIVAAYLECIAGGGLRAGSISAVARALGLDRSTLHHYFRTADDLVAAGMEEVIERYRRGAAEAVAGVPAAARLDALLDHLLGAEYADAELSAILVEFGVAARQDPRALAELQRAYRALEDTVHAEIAARYPDADSADRRRVGLAIAQLGEGLATLREIGLAGERVAAARAAADALLARLEPSA